MDIKLHQKPLNIKEYKNWVKDKFSIELSNKDINYYHSVTNKIISEFKSNPFWKEFNNLFNNYNQTYFVKNNYKLYSSSDLPELKIKPYDSFILKTFRKNIINNGNFPQEPEGGWYLPENWYSRISDIVRTIISVKYLDGVDYLIERLSEICKQNDLKCNTDYEAKEEGYYAAHFYVEVISEIPKENWDTIKIPTTIEIQITTQIQEIIKNLLHKYYESNRKKILSDSKKWQWDYKSDEFATNYLGHILHYVEGMIMEIREKQNGDNK